MTGDTEWYPQLIWLASVQTEEEEESYKICDIAQTPKAHELETDIIMNGIGDVFVDQ